MTAAVEATPVLLAAPAPLPATRPELSVVIPLYDDHGMAEACLASWNRQTFDRSRLQLVVVDHGVGRRRAARLHALLRPHDLWVRAPSTNESVLYDRGARAANADLLLFTEAHCVADRAAAEEVLRTLADEELAAAVVAGTHLEGTALARQQSALEREWHASWPSGHWRTISLRGFAVRRETYLDLGGFEAAHERFCEIAFGAALVRSGLRVGRTARAVIQHQNAPRTRELVDALASCGRGQLAWRSVTDAQTPGLSDVWLGANAAWDRRGALQPAAARTLVRGLLASLRADRGRDGSLVKARRTALVLPPMFAAAAAGPRAAHAAARLRLSAALVRWYLARLAGRPLLPPYQRLWQRAFDVGFAAHLARHPVEPHWAPVGSRPTAIAELSEGALAGVYGRERWNGDDDGPLVRWTGPAALLRLRIPPDHRRLRLELRSPLPPAQRCLTAFLDGRRLRDDQLRLDTEGLELALAPPPRSSDDRHELTLTCRTFRRSESGSTDGRLLGVALFSVAAA